MPKLAIHFARLGPYHIARIESAFNVLRELGWEVVGFETGGGDHTYAWSQETAVTEWRWVTVFPGEAAEAISSSRLRRGVMAKFDQLKPDAIAVAGWATADARACLHWCRKAGSKAVLMSETRESDGNRVWWKELIKARIVRRFDAALVGGKSHRNYLLKLGFENRPIALGYDVVNNDYFSSERNRWKSEDVACRPYFLASNRFIERKNLKRLVDAFVAYVSEGVDRGDGKWDLCLLGDGELKCELVDQCRRLGLNVAECAPWELGSSVEAENSALPLENFKQPTVYFPGFRQIDELPRFYAHAGCFVHPALEEPWGLVINEAMASSLPVLSSTNVGAAEELIDDGVNGWTFDALSTESIRSAIVRVARLKVSDRVAMGERSSEILRERCPTSAFGSGLAELLSAVQ